MGSCRKSHGKNGKCGVSCRICQVKKIGASVKKARKSYRKERAESIREKTRLTDAKVKFAKSKAKLRKARSRTVTRKAIRRITKPKKRTIKCI